MSSPPGAQLFVGEWADGDFGFVAQRPDGTQITVNVPPDHARALIAALDRRIRGLTRKTPHACCTDDGRKTRPHTAIRRCPA